MSEPDLQKQMSDAVIVCAGMVSGNRVVLHTASKRDAEFLYTAVDTVAVSDSRTIEQTDADGIHREYYLELADSDEHSLQDEDDFSWNTRKVWQVTFEPTEYLQQRMMHWADENHSYKAPRDFKMTPLIAKVIYYAGAHEMAGLDAPYVEFDAVDVSKLDAELKNLDIESINVGELWRLDEENSARFREYADIPEPNYDGGETSDADD